MNMVFKISLTSNRLINPQIRCIMDIVERIKNGDEEAFKDTFYSYSRSLYNFLYSKTKSEYHSNEVVQLTFIKLWKYRDRLSENVKLSTQLFQIAKTTLIDELRKEECKKLRTENFLKRENLFKEHFEDGYTLLLQKDNQHILQGVVDRMPPVRKKVFQLSRNEQMSHKEISEEMSISVKTVDKHIQLALRFIRPFLNIITPILIFYVK